MVNNSIAQIPDFEEIQTASAHPGVTEYKQIVFSTQLFSNNKVLQQPCTNILLKDSKLPNK